MSNTAIVIGNLARDPEMRYTPNGVAVCEITVADTPSNFDKQSGQWVDGETDWVRVTIWKKQAENVANSLRKGDEVIVIGRYVVDKFTDKKTGEERTSRKLIANDIGPSLRWVTAALTRASSGGGGGNSFPSGGGNQPQQQNSGFNQNPGVGDDMEAPF